MLLGYNTNGLQNHRLDDALRLLADHGYRAVALTPDVQHLDPYRCTAKQVGEIAALLDELGIHPTIETGARFLLDPAHKHEPTLMTRDADARKRRVDFFERVARIGKDLGASVVSFFSGIDRGPSEDAVATLEAGVAAACVTIRGCGMTPALEPEPGMAVATVADFLRLRGWLERRDPTAAPELCLDVGHIYVTREGRPADVIPAVAAHMVQVHLEDIRTGVHEHLLPGDGDVDFTEVRTTLHEVGYDGPVCFELSRSSHLGPKALEICRRTWDDASR